MLLVLLYTDLNRKVVNETNDLKRNEKLTFFMQTLTIDCVNVCIKRFGVLLFFIIVRGF